MVILVHMAHENQFGSLTALIVRFAPDFQPKSTYGQLILFVPKCSVFLHLHFLYIVCFLCCSIFLPFSSFLPVPHAVLKSFLGKLLFARTYLTANYSFPFCTIMQVIYLSILLNVCTYNTHNCY